MSAGLNGRRLAALAVVATALALPSAAAAETFRGKTAQGKPVSLETRPDGEVRKVTWRWRTSSCKDSDLRLKTQSTVLKNPRSRKPGTFASKGSYVAEFSDATIRFKVSSAGRQRSPSRWSGTFKAKAIVDLKRGKDTVCKLRRISWAATT
jgi:hypothetical protein